MFRVVNACGYTLLVFRQATWNWKQQTSILHKHKKLIGLESDQLAILFYFASLSRIENICIISRGDK